MSINLNRVTITGHLVSDPVLRGLPSGKSVCDMRIACNRKWQNKLTGSWEDWVDYIEAQAIDTLAPFAHQLLRKGSGVAIDGRLTSQPAECEDTGHPRRLIVLAEEMHLIPKASALLSTSRNPASVLATDDASYATDALPRIDPSMGIDALPASTITAPLEY
jgi:single stranded DNA-binding protein